MTWSKILKKFKSHRGGQVGLFFICIFVLIAIFAPALAPFEPSVLHDNALRLPPAWSQNSQAGFFLGTDDIGRDLLSRLIYGARISIGTGFFVVFISFSIGVFLGLLAGYFGGKTDSIISRFVDILMSLPSILIAIVIAAILGPSLVNGILAVSIVALPGFIRIVRASVMSEKEKLYVQAEKNFGAGHARILFKNILPNCWGPIIVQSTLAFSDGILNVAALGFLGLGAQAPTPEWGVMLADYKPYMESSPWLVTLPGLCILIVVLAFNLLGDALRDILDPK